MSVSVASPSATTEVTPAGLIAAAAALRPELVAAQAEVEQRTYFSEEMHQRFIDLRFYDMYVPRRYGGLEFDVPTFLAVTKEIARGCVSTAWCFALSANHALLAATLFPERVQDVLFGAHDFRGPSTVAPTLRATRAGDEWRIDGTVQYCSGVPYSTYYIGQIMIEGAGEDGGPGLGAFVAPRSIYTVLDDWGSTLGLKGSGSHSIRFDGGTVPKDWVIPGLELNDVPVEHGTLGYTLHRNHLYAGRELSIFTMSLAAILVGAGYNALDEYAAQMRTRMTPVPPIVPRIEDPDFQRWYGAALTKVATAEATLEGISARYMEYARLNALGERPFTFEDDFMLAGVAREILVQVWEAIEQELYRTIGSSAAKAGQRFERVFRDLAQAAGHRNTSLRDQSYRVLATLELGAGAPVQTLTQVAGPGR